MSGPAIVYKLMPRDADSIRRLVDDERYRNADAFMDRAVSILLTWESDHPERTLEIMKLMQFTPEQEAFISTAMNEDVRKESLGETEAEKAIEESRRHEALSISDFDHSRVAANRSDVRRSLRRWSPPSPSGAYKYDGYPMLFKLYSRFLPVKITVAVLGNMLYEGGVDHVSLDGLRAAAYDIAEEYAGNLAKEEREGGVRRNMRVSTGLPTKGASSGSDSEKRAHAQKRFKDQYVGRVRRDRATGTGHADGAPAALGLVTIFEEDGEQRVTLTDAGRRFCMMSNPVVDANKDGRALGRDEAAFILDDLLPRLPLENMFVKAALDAVRAAGAKGATAPEMDGRFLKAAVSYAKKNREKAAKFGLDMEDYEEKAGHGRIVGWRVATMGRLAEIGAVAWEVGEKGVSVFLVGDAAARGAGGGARGRRRREGQAAGATGGRGRRSRGPEKII